MNFEHTSVIKSGEDNISERAKEFAERMTGDAFWEAFKQEDGGHNPETVKKIRAAIQREIRNINTGKPKKI